MKRYFELSRALLFYSAVCVLLLSRLAAAQSVAGDQGSDNGSFPSLTSQSEDCNNPAMSGSVQCNSNQGQAGAQSSGNNTALPIHTPVLESPANQNQEAPTPAPSAVQQAGHFPVKSEAHTEFEQMVADSVGRVLPIFGESLFSLPPNTFSPVEGAVVPDDYVVGPGDELQIKVWGQVQADLRVIVDRAGEIYIPQIGSVRVAGLRYGELEDHIKQEFSKIFKNFNISVNLGHLRSIQVVVVGNVRYPGTYTISSVSTLIDAVLASGGPSPNGSMRHIQVRRNGATITDFDFYDLLCKGDNSKDVHLSSGDIIFIPPVGPLVAVSGSVKMPAIYEIKKGTSLDDLLELVGGFSTVADISKITIERLVDHQARTTLEFPYDDQSKKELLQDGDIVRVFSIVPRFENTVTLRGNVANPGRYPWKPEMKITDLIPDAQALLTRDYWRNRANIVNGSATAYPLNPKTNTYGKAPFDEQNRNATNGASPQNSPENAVPGSAQNPQSNPAERANAQFQPETLNGERTGEGPDRRDDYSSNAARTARNVARDFRRSAPEINWDYAVIQRVDPKDLSSKLIWMSPRKAIIEHDPDSDLSLEPGDIVTIFSQNDISVPQAERSQYVIVEGEVRRPGVYKLNANETLRSVLQRAGGLTPDAYIYGSQLTRESARIDQQKSLDELARTMEVQIRQSAVTVAASSAPGDLPQMQAAQEAIISQLRSTRASGRVALPIRPGDKDISDFPDILLEDNDHLTVPHIPSTVSVIGDVYNPGSFIFQARNDAGDYLEIAGKGKPQSDMHHAFIVRANGVVVAANNVNGPFSGDKFERLHLYPGDQIVVPYKLPTGAFMRGLRDWTQVTSQIALTAAALAVIAP